MANIVAAILIDVKQFMAVVAHDGIGTDADGKYSGQQQHAINNPLSAMLKVVATVSIFSARKGSPNAAADAMVVRGICK